MERFQSTKIIKEYKQKQKTANTAKATTQWMRVFLSVGAKERPLQKY